MSYLCRYITAGVATLFVWWAEKQPQKTWRAEKCVQNSLGAKFTLIKTNNGANLTLNIPLSTIITSNHIKFNSSYYNCVLFYRVLQNSQ